MWKSKIRSLVIDTPLEKPAKWALQRLRASRQRSGLPRLNQLKIAGPHTFKAFELPDDLTEDQLWNVYLSFAIDEGPIGELDPYAHDAFYRFIHSWQLVRNETGKCLELGANPYFITWLLNEHTNLDMTLANYFGGEDGQGKQTLTWDDRDGRVSRELKFDHFNMEESRFPYDDASFEVVLYCEIIEHLLMNPVHTLKEIRRVLKPGGLLVVTTPNVARFGNVLAMMDGQSIYDPYSGFGPYGRHNREFSMAELLHLLEFAGFSHESSFTADAHRVDFSQHPKFAQALESVGDRPAHLGQYLFAAVRADSIPQRGLPASLFRSYPTEELNSAW